MTRLLERLATGADIIIPGFLPGALIAGCRTLSRPAR
jgi:hypothetical protein